MFAEQCRCDWVTLGLTGKDNRDEARTETGAGRIQILPVPLCAPMSSDNTPLVVCYKGIKWFTVRVQMFGACAFPHCLFSLSS
jgi:hypothetical protein